MELKITKQKVLDAANSCSTAKEILSKMFPEVFKEEYKEYELLGEEGKDHLNGDILFYEGPVQLGRVNYPEYGIKKHQHLYLYTGQYDYELIDLEDITGDKLLVMRKK